MVMLLLIILTKYTSEVPFIIDIGPSSRTVDTEFLISSCLHRLGILAPVPTLESSLQSLFDLPLILVFVGSYFHIFILTSVMYF
jgi:hypothetical protein